MSRMQSGGGMPPMDELLQDPSLRDMCVNVLFPGNFSTHVLI